MADMDINESKDIIYEQTETFEEYNQEIKSETQDIESNNDQTEVNNINKTNRCNDLQMDLINEANTGDNVEKQNEYIEEICRPDQVNTFDTSLSDQEKNENYIENPTEGKPDKNKEIIPCDPCLFDDVQEIASSFCVVCVEYLCTGCARDHRRSKATRNHRVLNDAEKPDDPNLFKIMKSVVACTEHPDMEVSYKCKTHEKFICTKCLVVSHRKCDEVIEISNLITKEQTSITNNTLQSVYEMTVSVRNTKEDNVKQLRTDSSCIQTEMTKYVEGLQEKIQKLSEKCMEETKNIISKTLGELEKAIDRCRELEEKEVELKHLLDVALSYGNTTEINIICEKVENDMKELKDETTKQKEKPVVSLKFDRNQSFEEIISVGYIRVVTAGKEESYQEKSLCDESIVELSSEEFGEKTLNAGNELQSKSLMQSSVSKHRTMYDIQSIASQPIEKSAITSMLILMDGRVALADYSNKQIKVLNKDFSIQMEKELNGKPIDICQYSRNMLALIIDGVKYLHKYQIGSESFFNYGQFPSKLYPISIESLSNNDDQVIILFSDEEKNIPKKSDYDKIEIQIRNMNAGQIIKTFTDFRNKTSLKMVLENPGRIRMLPSASDTFFVSENMKLRCVEKDKDDTSILKEKWYYKSYRGSIIAKITDIALDKEGNIYICGKDSKNIHQISSSNYMKNRVLLTVTGSPLSLCVDDANRQLIVGCENDDFIYVIRLE